jgi:phosphonoacetaldehyde hydrolase
MWTIGLAKTGNEMGLSQEEVERLAPEEYRRRIDRAYERMTQAGAHYVVDAIADVMPCLEDIDRRLASGERP